MTPTASTAAVPAPLPRVARFERLGYGLFVHFGLYSLIGRGEWVRRWHNFPPAEYEARAKQFTAAGFDAKAYVRLARDAGMKYICLTTRHHEGFSLYDTSPLDSLGHDRFDSLHHAPCGRDLVREFVDACRAGGVVPFLYHTTLDWRRQTETISPADFAKYIDYLVASVELLCTRYGEVGGFWFDGNWSRKDADWQETRLYSAIRAHQPNAIIINNSSTGALGAERHPEVDSVTFEQGIPKPPDRAGKPKYIAGEMCQTMNHHWGRAGRDFAYLSPKDLIRELAACRRVGANYLLNIGPNGDGSLPDHESAALRRAGEWAKLHAEALYDVTPAPELQCRGGDFVLRHDDGQRLLYFANHLAVNHNLHLAHGRDHEGPHTVKGLDRAVKSVRWMDNGEPLKFAQSGELFTFDATNFPYGEDLVVRVAEIT